MLSPVKYARALLMIGTSIIALSWVSPLKASNNSVANAESLSFDKDKYPSLFRGTLKGATLVFTQHPLEGEEALGFTIMRVSGIDFTVSNGSLLSPHSNPSNNNNTIQRSLKDQAIGALLQNVDQLFIRTRVMPEILQAVKSGAFKVAFKIDNENNESFDEVTSFIAYSELLDGYMSAQKTKSLFEAFKNKSTQALNEKQQENIACLNQKLAEQEQKLKDYSLHRDTFSRYARHIMSQPDYWLSYTPESEDSIGVLGALAQILGVEVHIWQINQEQGKLLQNNYRAYPAESIKIHKTFHFLHNPTDKHYSLLHYHTHEQIVSYLIKSEHERYTLTQYSNTLAEQNKELLDKVQTSEHGQQQDITAFNELNNRMQVAIEQYDAKVKDLEKKDIDQQTQAQAKLTELATLSKKQIDDINGLNKIKREQQVKIDELDKHKKEQLAQQIQLQELIRRFSEQVACKLIYDLNKDQNDTVFLTDLTAQDSEQLLWLMSHLKMYPHIIKLKLENSKVPHLTQMFQGTQVHTVHLSGNQIGAVGARDFGQALKGTHVHTVDLLNNQIGDVGARDFGQALKGTQVHTVYLGLNQIGDVGARDFGQALKGTQVQNVYLWNNQIGAVGARDFGQALKGTRVHTVDLALNQIGSVGARDFGQALKGTQVQNVYLRGNQIEAVGARDFGQALKGTRVHTVDLALNQIGSVGARDFGQALKGTQVQNVYLRGNMINPKTELSLKELLPNITFTF